MLYDSLGWPVRDDERFFPAFVVCLPTVWWLAQEIPGLFYDGWFHDERFFDIYWLPATFFSWLSERTGDWWGQTYWVATQDAVVGITIAAGLGLLLRRSQAWTGQPGLRAVVAAVGVLLPWYRLVESLDRPDYYALGAYSLAGAYGIAAVGGFLLPTTPQVRAVLLGLALAIGGSLALWRLEQWSWLLSGSLAASLALLVRSAVRVVKNEQVV